MAVEDSEIPDHRAVRSVPIPAAPAESVRPWSRSGELAYGCMLFVAAAARYCEELRAAVEDEDWKQLSPGLRVTMSVGLATLQDEPDAAAVLHHADTCLYEAKRLGRNRVVARPDLRYP